MTNRIMCTELDELAEVKGLYNIIYFVKSFHLSRQGVFTRYRIEFDPE